MPAASVGEPPVASILSYLENHSASTALSTEGAIDGPRGGRRFKRCTDKYRLLCNGNPQIFELVAMSPLAVPDRSIRICADRGGTFCDVHASYPDPENPKERKELAWQRDHAYDDVFSEENLAMNSNQDRDEDFLDDFM